MEDRPATTDGFRAFVDRYQQDQERGTIRTIREYIDQFPDASETIVLQYAALRAAAIPKAIDVGDTLGPYRLEELIGRGTQGLVYRGAHTRTGQRVAVKVLANYGNVTERLLQYFQREALIAARFDHPGLCPVYDAGIEHGVPYLAMRFVDGQNLDELLTRRQTAAADVGQTTAPAPTPAPPVPLGPTSWNELSALLWFVEEAARAIQAAHETGVFHRDIKPSNLMVTADGKPVVLDFGLSHLDDPMLHSLTRTGDLIGTPRYMSPEQLTRKTIPLDRRTDIWSLGVVLYECATLQPPFASVTREGLYQQILTREPVRPRRLNPALTRDVETVILSALEKDRGCRYQTALDFAEDLRRVRMREPVLAVPPGFAVRTLRWAQRHPGVAIASALLLLSLTTGLVVSLLLLSEKNLQYAEATRLQGENDLLADSQIVGMLEAGFDALWPATAALAPQMRDWIENANRLVGHRDRYDAALNRLADVEAAPGFAPTPDHSWRKELFGRLAAAVVTLPERIKAMQHRLAEARTLWQCSIGDHLDVWQRAADEVAKDDRFRGMARLQPQLGLVPLGADPVSRLQEFAVLGSGDIPTRDDADWLVITEDSAIVLVLLPRGSFVMGSPADEPGHQASEARAEIHLLPFLLGKHEISQAQWLRATGKNPASGSPTNGVEGVTITLLHPVEAVSWLHGQEFARRLGLRLPTEAQWEYGCRAGSTTAYAFGDDVACLQQHQVNLADASLQRLFEQPFPQQVAWDDGHPYHAPITTGDVNAWGLVAMLGNVAELCRDEWLNQRQPVLTPGDGLAPSSDDSRRVFRGGGWQFGAIYSRSAYREPVHQAESSAVHGLRVERPLL